MRSLSVASFMDLFWVCFNGKYLLVLEVGGKKTQGKDDLRNVDRHLTKDRGRCLCFLVQCCRKTVKITPRVTDSVADVWTA